jgi:hypothetical protein
MNTAQVTTGLIPLTIGSTQTFQCDPLLNGLPWDLSNGSALLILADPSGNETIITATVIGVGATASWTVVGPAGTWVRAWQLTDSTGLIQVSQPIPFAVVSSPV